LPSKRSLLANVLISGSSNASGDRFLLRQLQSLLAGSIEAAVHLSNKADSTMLSHKETTARGRVEFMRLDSPEIRVQIHQLSKLDNFQGFFRLGGNYAV
jgi:hypothetical protein